MPDANSRVITIKTSLYDLIKSQPDFSGSVPSYLDKIFKDRQKTIEMYKNSVNQEFVAFVLAGLPNIPKEQIYEILYKTLEYLQKKSLE